MRRWGEIEWFVTAYKYAALLLFLPFSSSPLIPSSRYLLLSSSLILLAACGFTPMHGAQNQPKLDVGVLIEAPNDAMGRQFKHNLEDQLNPQGVPLRPAYKLQVSLENNSVAVGVARDGTVSRYNILLSSQYTLTRLSDNAVIKTDTLQHVSSFNNQINAYFSTVVSQKDATKRGIEELSALYRQRIGALLAKGSPA